MGADIQQRVVIQIIAEVAGRDPATLDLDHDLVMDVGLDSLDTVELAMQLEEQFELFLPDEAIEGMRRVSDVVAMVDRMTGGGVAA